MTQKNFDRVPELLDRLAKNLAKSLPDEEDFRFFTDKDALADAAQICAMLEVALKQGDRVGYVVGKAMMLRGAINELRKSNSGLRERKAVKDAHSMLVYAWHTARRRAV